MRKKVEAEQSEPVLRESDYRVQFCMKKIRQCGCEPTLVASNQLEFTFKGETVTFYTHSGYYTGKSVEDGCGLKNLLKQLKV